MGREDGECLGQVRGLCRQLLESVSLSRVRCSRSNQKQLRSLGLLPIPILRSVSWGRLIDMDLALLLIRSLLKVCVDCLA